MPEIKESMLGKIQALMKKTVANGCTEAEAQLAAEKASKLLLKYNLDMQQVTEHGTADAQEVGHDNLQYNKTGVKNIYWQRELIKGCCEITNCKILFSSMNYDKGRAYMTIIGKPLNVQSAKQMFNFLSTTFVDLAIANRKMATKCAQLIGEKIGSGYLNAYLTGMSDRVVGRMRRDFDLEVEKQEAKKYLMAVNTENREYMYRTFRVRNRKAQGSSAHNNSSAYGRGYTAGANVGLREHKKLGGR